MKPRKETISALRHSVVPTEVTIIGDGNVIGNVYTAVHQGFDAAINL